MWCQSLPVQRSRLASRWACELEKKGRWHRKHLERFRHKNNSRFQTYNPGAFRNGVPRTIERSGCRREIEFLLIKT